MSKIQYGIFLNGEYVDTKDLKEAEDRFKRVEKSDFSFTFIVRKEFSKDGKLLSEIMIG